MPVLNSISPSSVSAVSVSEPLTLDLKGSAFDHTTRVWFNNSTQRPATFVSSTDIQVVLTAQEAQTPANIDISLYTPVNKDPESCSSGGFSKTN